MFQATRAVSRLAAPILGAALLLGSGTAYAQNAGQLPFTNWLTYLQASPQNYTVTQGTAIPFPGCSLFVTYLGSCFGNNSATPYIIINAPPSATNNLPSYIQTYLSNGTAPNLTYDFWQLDINEALVIIITLPPQAAFLSYQSYMFERSASNLTYTDPPPTVPTPPGHCTPGSTYMPNSVAHSLSYDCNYNVFGFFTNAVNGADLESAYNPPFNTTSPQTYNTIAIITSPNQTLAGNLVSTFQSLGNNPALMFTEGMPSAVPPGSPVGTLPLLFPGVTSSSDIYASLIRYAVPEDNVAGPYWLMHPRANVLVFRVKEPSSGLTDTLYNSSNLNVPGYNTDEVVNDSAPCPTTGTYQSYNCDLTEISNLLTSWTAANHPAETYATVPAIGGGLSGPGCIMNGTNCAGGTQDASAYRKLNIGTLGAYEAFFFGVNHASSGGDIPAPTSPIYNAHYTGVSAAIALTNTGITDVTQPNVTATFSPTTGPTLSGSASAVLTLLHLTASPRLMPDLPNLYISVFCRAPGSSTTCAAPFNSPSSQPYLTTITSMSGLPNYIPSSAAMMLVERGYQLPATTGLPLPPAALTGANPFHTENPRILCDVAGGGGC